MAVEKIDVEKCNGCGICAMACPMDVIRIDEVKKKAYIAYPGDCITCFNCEEECPLGAIYVGPERRRSIPFPW